jgi:hypothetical protein
LALLAVSFTHAAIAAMCLHESAQRPPISRQCVVVIHSGTLSSPCCSFFGSQSEKTKNRCKGNTTLPQAKRH